MGEAERQATMFGTIEQAIEDLRNGRIVIVADDEDRENEGDFVCAAQLVTPELINFMAQHGRGLICLTLTPERCDQLGLPQMAEHNTEELGTAFTISIDADLIHELRVIASALPPAIFSSISGAIVEATRELVERMRREYNDGEPFTSETAPKVRTGRRQGRRSAN